MIINAKLQNFQKIFITRDINTPLTLAFRQGHQELCVYVDVPGTWMHVPGAR